MKFKKVIKKAIAERLPRVIQLENFEATAYPSLVSVATLIAQERSDFYAFSSLKPFGYNL